MKNATSNAPHICLKVRANTFFRVSTLGRRKRIITSQDARMDVPPLSGLKLKVEAMGFCVTDEMAPTLHLCANLPGRCDHGPVHSTTTTIRMMYGSHARKALLVPGSTFLLWPPTVTERSLPPLCAAASALACCSEIIFPPKARMFFGLQTFTNSNSTQNETSAPLKSGRYGP